MGANSGKLEATLLASAATSRLAAHIVERVCPQLAPGGGMAACSIPPTGQACPAYTTEAKPLLVFTEQAVPNFDAYDMFRMQLESIEAQLVRALPAGDGTISAGVMGLPAAATVLSALANLFRSDYKLSALDVSQSDALLVRSFIEKANARCLDRPIVSPSLLQPRLEIEGNPALARLNTAGTLRDRAASRSADQKRAMSAEKAKTDPEIARLDEAVARFDAFLVKLGTPNEKGSVPLAMVARQGQLDGLIDESTPMLILKAEMAGGSAYAKKNFWTFLGGMPFSVSGGSLVSFTLVRGRSAEIVDAGVLRQTEPFMKIHAATKRFSDE
mgnify:FL=1